MWPYCILLYNDDQDYFTPSDDVDYVGQSGSCSFPVGSMSFDIQCLYIPIIDNNFPDGTRHFTVSLMTFDQLICVPPGQAVLTVMIIDNDRKSDMYICISLVYTHLCTILETQLMLTTTKY